MLVDVCEAVEKAAETVRVGYRSAVLMSVVVIGLFCTVFVYDMMADVFGSLVGGLVVLKPTVDGLVVYGVGLVDIRVVLCLLCDSVFKRDWSGELHSQSNPG